MRAIFTGGSPECSSMESSVDRPPRPIKRRAPWPTGRGWRGGGSRGRQPGPALSNASLQSVERQRQADKTQVAAGLCLNHAERPGLRVGDELGPRGRRFGSILGVRAAAPTAASFFGLPICPTRRKTSATAFRDLGRGNKALNIPRQVGCVPAAALPITRPGPVRDTGSTEARRLSTISNI